MANLILLSLVFLQQAEAASISEQVLYFRTGKESVQEAAKAAKEELEWKNPCASALTSDLHEVAENPAITRAAADVALGFLLKPEPSQHLVLHISNGSIVLRFELRDAKEKPLFRKDVKLTERPGTWKARFAQGGCQIKSSMRERMIGLLSEPTRLYQCKTRKIELLETSSKITHFLHEYVPDAWIKRAQDRIPPGEESKAELLQASDEDYRRGNRTYRACKKGLGLLEAHAANSIHLLRDVAATEPNAELPQGIRATLDKLQRLLDEGLQ